MKRILVLGAGRSSTALIQYFHKSEEAYELLVADRSTERMESLFPAHAKLRYTSLDATDSEMRRKLISNCELVISMLPASFHPSIADDCLELEKHLVTASYISTEMKAKHEAARSKDLIFMNECGVDPGIDHMSALKTLDRLKEQGAKITCFESFTGGLLAPESDNNPWHYKFTWNPRNVVLAGQGRAVKFIQEGQYKFIPYHNLFRRTEYIDIDGYGRFEGYANRDSLWYREIYGLHEVPTIYRGTLRRPGFCKAWDVFVKLGATDDSYVLEDSEHMTYRQFINTFLAYNPHDSVELKLMAYLKIDQDSEIMEKLEWLGIFKDKKIGLKRATPAQILEHILKEKWTMDPDDKDMIVMWHRFSYTLNGEDHELHASMACLGEDQNFTAMAKTVGLPVAIMARMALDGSIVERGVMMPEKKEVYEVCLKELESYGIEFKEKEVEPRYY
jgi:saccharopine dehydrogenase-like NADP-dependent oxidoreductase